MSDLYCALCLCCDAAYRACRTNFRAFRTFGTAVAFLERHFGLHECHETCAGLEYSVRTGRDAELTSRTVVAHVSQALGSRWDDTVLSRRTFFGLDVSQTAIYFHVLSIDERCSGEECRCRQELTTVGVGSVVVVAVAFRSRSTVTYGSALTLGYAISAYYTARHIDGVLFGVDTCRLAIHCAKSATVAFACINHRTKP